MLAVFEVGIQFQGKELHFLTYLVLGVEAVQRKVVEKKVSHYRSTQREVVNKKQPNKTIFFTNCLHRLDPVFLPREKVA